LGKDLESLHTHQHRLEAAGFDLGARLVQSLGVERASALSGLAWRKIAPMNKRHARARAHLQLALPELGDESLNALLDSMWDNLGRTTAETFHIETLMRESERFSLDDATHEAIALAKTGGAVFVSLHLGNWELAAPILNRFGLKVAGVYQRIHNPLIDARAIEARAPFYALGLYPKGHETARKLLRILNEGGAVTIMADLRDHGGISVPFFGRPAPSTVFPALIARAKQVPIFAGAVFREEGVRFRVAVRPVLLHLSEDRDADLLAMTTSIQGIFEDFIRQSPGQWMWGHRRWHR
jgi:Kdo2-lipid IVA lauroyltransferase/acyltransferase